MNVMQTWRSFNQASSTEKQKQEKKTDLVLSDLNQLTKNRCVKVDKEDDKDSASADNDCQ